MPAGLDGGALEAEGLEVGVALDERRHHMLVLERSGNVEWRATRVRSPVHQVGPLALGVHVRIVEQ